MNLLWNQQRVSTLIFSSEYMKLSGLMRQNLTMRLTLNICKNNGRRPQQFVLLKKLDLFWKF